MYLHDIVLSGQKIRDEAWMADDHQRMENLKRALAWTYANCVTDLFVLGVRSRRVQTKNTGKVIVDLNDRIAIPIQDSIRKGPPLLSFEWPLRSAATDAQTAYEKKKAVLDVLHDSTKWLAGIQGWDVAAIDGAYTEILGTGIIHAGFWNKGKRWRSPNGLINMRVYYECEERLRIYCVFYEGRDTEIGRKVVIDEPALDAPFMCYWKDIKWISDSSLLLRTKDGRSVKCNMKDLESDGGSRHGE